jgi:AAA domain
MNDAPPFTVENYMPKPQPVDSDDRRFADCEDMHGPASKPPRPRFAVEAFEDIRFDSCEEWLIKRLLPRRGVGVFYGASQSFKSFLVSHVAWHVALGWEWAGRRVTQAPAFYVAAEGAAGLRKRKVGFEIANAGLPSPVPFYMISSAPNLGTERGDLEPLIVAIEGAAVAPGLIVIDTLAQSLGAGDENGAGMIQFVANATTLANHFNCLVLIVHHVGLADDKRMRGHSSLIAGIDAQILCERREGEMSTNLTVQKLKDEESNLKFTARLSRVIIAQDEEGDEVSTLVVDAIEEGSSTQVRKSARSIPRAQRLLMDVVATALEEAAVLAKPLGENGPQIQIVAETAVRNRYFASIAEQAEPGEDKKTLVERQKKAFNRSIKAALEAKTLCAREMDGKRILWLA